MAFLACFSGGFLVSRNSNHQQLPRLIPPQTRNAIAFLLRPRTSSFLTLANPSPSLLRHHHHHHRLLSTSNSGAGADYPNYNNPSPSVLREVREAFKQISSSLYNCDPASPIREAEHNLLLCRDPANFDPSRELDNKLEQLKVSAWSLRHKQAIDHQRVLDMDESRVDFCMEFKKNLHEFLIRLEDHAVRHTIELPQIKEKVRNEFDSFLASHKRCQEMTVELHQVTETLTHSRLAFLEEIIKDLSVIRKDLQLQVEVFDELNEGLMKVKEMEEKGLELAVKNIKDQLASLEENFEELLQIRRGMPIVTGTGADYSNSNNPSPSLLREVREVFKKLQVNEYTLVTPFRDLFPPLPYPAVTNVPFPNSKEVVAAADSRNLDEKLEQLKFMALSFKNRKASDCQRLWGLMESKWAFIEEITEDSSEFLKVYKEHHRNGTLELPQTREKIDKEIGTLITRLTVMNDDTVEIMELEEVLINSRLASLYEMVVKLSEIKKDLPQEVWNELNEGVMRVEEMERKEFQMLAEDANQQLVFFQQRIHNLQNQG